MNHVVLIEVGFFWVDEGIRDQGIVDEGIHDPFPDGWPALKLLICICWNERLTQFFLGYLCLKKEVLRITNCHGYVGLNSRTSWPKILRWRNFTLLLMILQHHSNNL